MNRYVHTTLKMGLAGAVTTLLALLIGLEHAVTGGILAVLSTQLTRRDSIRDALRRLVGVGIGLVIGTIAFVIFGYSVVIFSVLTFVYAGVLFALKLGVAIVPGLVLVNHLLGPGAFAWSALGNAAALMSLAVAVALLLNVTYPLNVQRSMQTISNTIDQKVSFALEQIADALSGIDIDEKEREAEDKAMGKLFDSAELHAADAVFGTVKEAGDYVSMRRSQWRRINRMWRLLDRVEKPHEYAAPLADYVRGLAGAIGKEDQATPQRETLQSLLASYREKPLPESREAFEARAVLFQMVFELESFLAVKIRFHETHPNWA